MFNERLMVCVSFCVYIHFILTSMTFTLNNRISYFAQLYTHTTRRWLGPSSCAHTSFRLVLNHQTIYKYMPIHRDRTDRDDRRHYTETFMNCSLL